MVRGHYVTYCTDPCAQDDEAPVERAAPCIWTPNASIAMQWMQRSCNLYNSGNDCFWQLNLDAAWVDMQIASNIISWQDTSSWKIQCGCSCWNLSCSHDKLNEMFWLGRRMAPHVSSCIIMCPVANPSQAKETHCMSNGLLWILLIMIDTIEYSMRTKRHYESKKTSKLLKQSLGAAATIPRCGGRELVSHRQAAQEPFNIIPAAAKQVLTSTPSVGTR